MKTIAVVQARMGSTRLPNKVMKEIDGVPMIGLLIDRLSKAKTINQIVVATTVGVCNESLDKYVSSKGYDVFRGDENDVLDRYYQVAKSAQASFVVRITGDCPLVDPALVDHVVEVLKCRGLDYVSNTLIPTYADGLDVEAFTFNALEMAWDCATSPFDREHVTPYLKQSDSFQKFNIEAEENFSSERWTVDEAEDFAVIDAVFDYFKPDRSFDWQDVLKLSRSNPAMFKLNQHLVRNEGASMGTGQKLWKRAKKVIPGGNMLLSKRAEMFLPNKWPAYFSRAEGCRVWDLDDKEYLDMSIMGIGTNILGYGHPEVDEAVKKVISSGNMSTLNCPEEVYLAERLIELHPWADMARFCRSGGEANAVAIRIARAASGKDKVAICGYHGWHDWYLAANLNDDQNLDGHLLPGLTPNGVPRNLKGSVLPFQYNNILELEQLIRDHDIGVIKMEVQRDVIPKNGFLKKVRELASKNGIVLIFDECTSGFRQCFGGLHKEFDVEPDIAMFGKALGNGYAITAIIGRGEYMNAAQSTFISSTFWTERIGPAAAIKTLEVMEREKSWNAITRTGNAIAVRWKDLAEKYELPIIVQGLPAMIGFKIDSLNMLKYKTYITQELLKKNILAATAVYACTEHSEEILDEYFSALDPVFQLIKQCESGRSIDDLLETPVCHDGFKRLN